MNRLNSSIILSAVLALASTAAIAATAPRKPQPLSLLGITLGQPLPMPSCNEGASGEMCYSEGRFPKDIPPLGMQAFDVNYGASERPAFVKYSRFTAYAIDGRIEGILIFTDGLKSQADVMRQLTEKFGKPATVTERELRNGFGATIMAYKALWKVGTSNVTFDDVEGDAATGTISAYSAKGEAKTAEQYKAMRAVEPRL